MDSAKSWVVAAACCWINVFSNAVFRSTAVLFVNMVQSLGMTREEASWPISVMGISYCLSAPVAGNLAKHVAIWKLTVCASLVASVSLAACFFGNSMPFLVVFLGILHGTSLGFLLLFNTVIGQHFSRYRAIASGIASSGYTIGGLIFPSLFQVLFDEYGTRGGLLLCGGIASHALGGALLYRLPPGANKHLPSTMNGTSTKNGGTRKTKADNFRRDISCAEEIEHSRPDDYSGSEEMDDEDIQQNSRGSRYSLNKTIQALSDNMPSEKSNILVSWFRRNERNIFKITLPSFFRLPMFYLIALSYAQIVFNMSTYLTVIVDFATDRDVSKWDAVLLAIYGVADVASRFGSGWISDKKYIKRSAVMSVHFFLWSASYFMLASAKHYPFHVVSAITAGWSNGATSMLVPVLVMELVDVQQFSFCFGLVTLIIVLPFCLRPVMIGFFRDTLGDYQGMFILLGACLSLSSFVWMWVFVRERRQEQDLQKINKVIA
ncbi:monocarboxylate transporter 1 [Ixodes scapularis]|uniref:monocarboxylate transporter 1 n=1 Tax=Ixodes scapularis TaxID=6945 RepID=UPI001A9DE4C1|nr:monocarboxylate transporter 1 [Ixodes scapularis]